MSKPIDLQIPHRLGRAEAKRRMSANIGKLQSFFPGGAEVSSSWAGDRLDLDIRALGQAVTATLDVEDSYVRLRLILPPLLAMAAAPIEAMLRSRGHELLEDHSSPS